MTDERARAAVERIAGAIADDLRAHPMSAVFGFDEWARMGIGRPLASWCAFRAHDEAGGSIEAEMQQAILNRLLEHLYDFGKRSGQPTLREPGYAAIVIHGLSTAIGHPLALDQIRQAIASLSLRGGFAIGIRRARAALGECPPYDDLDRIAPTVCLLCPDDDHRRYHTEATAKTRQAATWACEAAQRRSGAEERTLCQALYLWLLSDAAGAGLPYAWASAIAPAPFRELVHHERDELVDRNLLQMRCLHCDARFRAPYRLDTEVPVQLRMWLCPECDAVIHDPRRQ